MRSLPIVKKAGRQAVVRLLDAKPKLREISETKTLLRMHAQALHSQKPFSFASILLLTDDLVCVTYAREIAYSGARNLESM